jgi:hypothetical protein
VLIVAKDDEAEVRGRRSEVRGFSAAWECGTTEYRENRERDRRRAGERLKS